MNKDYLEALNTIRENLSNKTFRFNLVELLDIIEKELKRLADIDNANPSEALKETLRDIAIDLEYDDNPYLRDRYYGLLDLKQALIKAQEHEKELKQIKEANPSEALECLEKVKGYHIGGIISVEEFLEETEEYNTIKQALQRLVKYEQILGSGRLTDRNYKNTTLDLDSCKPYLRLGQLEDIYEETKK